MPVEVIGAEGLFSLYRLGLVPWVRYASSPEERWRRLVADRDDARRRAKACEAFDRRRAREQRGALRDVVTSTQRLVAAAPEAFEVLNRGRAGQGRSLYEFIADVRANRIELEGDLDLAQRVLIHRWADAALLALAVGVSEDWLHALFATSGKDAMRWRRRPHASPAALSVQLERLAHVVWRNAPPAIALAEPREARAFSGVMTAA